MERGTLRIIFTILMYVGVLLCVLPHLSGIAETASITFLITGGFIAVASAVLRCCCAESEDAKHSAQVHHPIGKAL